MNWSKLGHFLVYWTFQIQKRAQIFLQTSPDISSQKIIAQYSFFYTVIPLNIKWSHVDFAIQIMIFLKKFFNMFEKIILFCTSIYIWKLISQKTQNNFFSAQIIVPPPHYAMKRNETSQNFKILHANLPCYKFYGVCSTHPNQIIGPIAFF